MKRIVIYTFLISLSTHLSAQKDLPVDVINVVKDFDAKLAEAEKIKVNPEIPGADTGKLTYRYDVNPGIQELKYSAPQIRPIAMKPAEPIPVYPFYLKAGYGIPRQAYGRLSYNFASDEHTQIGIDFLHHSANNNNADHQQQRFFENNLNGHLLYLTQDGMAIQGNAFLTKNQYYNYGHYIENPGTLTSPEILRHRYDIFGVGAKVFNPKVSANGVNYFAGLDLYNLVDNVKSSEKNANIHLGVTKWIQEQHSLSLELGTDLTHFEDPSKSTNLSNFYLLPSVGIHGKSFSLQGGVRITSDGDQIKVHPAVNLAGSIAGNSLMAIAGADGGLSKNNYKTLSEYNPFISSRINLANNEYEHYYAGIKGSASSLEYDARVGYKTNKNLPLFILNTANFSRFDVLYRSVNFYHATASLTLKPSKQFIINATVNQNVYKNIATEAKAWGLPSLEVNGSVHYQSLNKKLLLTAESYVADGIPYKTDHNVTGNSKLLMDISLGADYNITKNFGIFVQANNLANNTWRRWYQYPTFGLNAVGGLTVKF